MLLWVSKHVPWTWVYAVAVLFGDYIFCVFYLSLKTLKNNYLIDRLKEKIGKYPFQLAGICGGEHYQLQSSFSDFFPGKM